MLPSSHTATVSGWNLCSVLALPHKILFKASQLSFKYQLAGPVSKPKAKGVPLPSVWLDGAAQRQGNIWHVIGKNLDKVKFCLTDRDPMTQHQWFFFLFPVTLVVRDDTYFFLIIPQLHIKNFYFVMVVKIIQQWCIFTVILIPKDKLNLIFSCIKLSHKTCSEFERLSNVAPTASKLPNVIYLSKTHWWVQSCWVQCRKNCLLTTLVQMTFWNCPWCDIGCLKMMSQSN